MLLCKEGKHNGISIVTVLYFQYYVRLFHKHRNACIRVGKQTGTLICDCVFAGAWTEHQHSVPNGPSATPRV